MNIYLEKVKEFMVTFRQNVADKPTELDEDTQKLRISLIFEELKEYAEASGQLDYFDKLCDNFSAGFHTFYKEREIDYVPVIDQVEQLDALADLQYVLSGAVLSHGFGEIFDAGFEEVQNSNMSKACLNGAEVYETVNKLTREGVDVYCNSPSFPAVVYRQSDNKVMKSINYKPAQLAQFLK